MQDMQCKIMRWGNYDKHENSSNMDLHTLLRFTSFEQLSHLYFIQSIHTWDCWFFTLPSSGNVKSTKEHNVLKIVSVSALR
jgi:hypothetical protein